MTTVNVEVVLKDSNAVKVEAATLPHGEPDTWNEAAVRDLLVEMLRAIDRVQNPARPARSSRRRSPDSAGSSNRSPDG